eukprot:COSAG01_NODE_3150_length_6507_cov_6.711142_4_plen_83_part_00
MAGAEAVREWAEGRFEFSPEHGYVSDHGTGSPVTDTLLLEAPADQSTTLGAPFAAPMLQRSESITFYTYIHHHTRSAVPCLK